MEARSEPQRQRQDTIRVRDTVMSKKDKMGWSTVDEPGVPFLAKKEELNIDSTYQRTMISETRVAQISQSWSWMACNSILVAERDKKFWVIDGQHRVAAAMRRSDILELPALVFKSTGAEQEALAFYRANCIRGAVTPYDKLRACLAASDQLAIDTVELMESMSYHPSSGDGEHAIRCIAAFMTALRLNRGVLTRVWPLIATLHEPLSIRRSVFDALLYIAKFGSDDITNEEWSQRVLRHGLHEIENQIARADAAFIKGGVKVKAIAALDVINKGVSRARRIQISETSADDDDE